MKDVKQLKEGDVLSETSHYIVKCSRNGSVILKHYEGGTEVALSLDYIQSFTNSADEVIEEVHVTKEDKKDGTKGIRSIFEGIHSSQVFTVCFKKQDKAKSKKAINAEIEAKTEAFVDAVNKARRKAFLM